MSTKTLTAHALFAALALALAWVVSNRVVDDKGGETSVTLLDADKGAVTAISYAWPKGTSKVASQGEGAARMAVVELSREIEKKDDKKKKKPAPDAGPADDEPEAVSAPPEREEGRFPGGKGVMTALEACEPLRSRRTLGVVDDGERLKAMGLAPPERTLTIATRKQSVTLEIGEASYGAQGRYARKAGDNVVHLIDAAIVTGLEGGVDALLEKRIVTAEAERVSAYGARHGDRLASYVHVDRDLGVRRYWAPAGDKGTKHEPSAKLMTTLRGLRATKLVTDDKLAGDVFAAFSLTIDERKAPLVIELLERTDGEGTLVKTEGWLFEISQTQSKELIEDLDASLDVG